MSSRLFSRHAFVDTTSPVNWAHALNTGLLSWWMVLPQWAGGLTWFDLTRRNPGTLTNFASPGTLTNGWNAPNRQGGFGHLALDGGSSGSHAYVSIAATVFPAT